MDIFVEQMLSGKVFSIDLIWLNGWQLAGHPMIRMTQPQLNKQQNRPDEPGTIEQAAEQAKKKQVTTASI